MDERIQEQALVSAATWVARRCTERTRGRNRQGRGPAPVRRAYRNATGSPRLLECIEARARRVAVEMVGTTPVVVEVEFRVPEILAPVGWWDSGWFEEWLKIAREGKGA